MAKEQEPQSNNARLTTESMLSVLREDQPDANRGTLENLCDQGLLPPRARTGQEGRRPIWTYPIGAERQLRALMVWREATHDPDLLRVALWVDGYPVDTRRVQQSIGAALNKMAADVHRAASAAAPPDASEAEQRRAFAAQAAGLRGRNTSIPRPRGVSSAERTSAVEALLNTFLFGQTGEVSDDTAKQVEQLFGLQGAREQVPATGAGPRLTGPPGTIFDLTPHVGLQRFLEVAQTATDVEMNLVRPSLNALLVGLPLVARLLSTVHGADAEGFGSMADLGRRPELPVLLVPVLIGLHRAGQAQGLMDVVAALEPVPALAAEILSAQDLPHAEIVVNLQNQSPEVAKLVEQLLDSPIDDLEATLKRQANAPNSRRAHDKRQS
jgi:hypothetical protein